MSQSRGSSLSPIKQVDEYSSRAQALNCKQSTASHHINQTKQISDYELAQEINKGAISRIGDLYERHKPRVYLLCLRMTGNVSEAEDLTQEVFVQLIGKVGSFRGESQFSTWLHRFTTNQVLMYFRRSARRKERFPNILDEIAATPRVKYSIGAQLMDRLALDAAVAKLPSGSRSIFLKFEVEGYNHDEIAGMFGCSVGNSKSQLHKARKKLRKLLSPA
ncbi:MAG: RNA polymerase subunit sigma-24 [Blastocatellia bacterium]|nr:MAG: RNA polymerase subunit sigma-24 [Blastocatellia bacterium]